MVNDYTTPILSVDLICKSHSERERGPESEGGKQLANTDVHSEGGLPNGVVRD